LEGKNKNNKNIMEINKKFGRKRKIKIFLPLEKTKEKNKNIIYRFPPLGRNRFYLR
jgi:hypothetical protein